MRTSKSNNSKQKEFTLIPGSLMSDIPGDKTIILVFRVVLMERLRNWKVVACDRGRMNIES